MMSFAPYESPTAAVVANAVFRRTRIGGKWICPLTDPFIQDGKVPESGNYSIGEVAQPQLIPSKRVCTDPTLWEALRALATWDRGDLSDALFLWRVSRRYQPVRFFWFRKSAMKLPRWFWFGYAFLVAKAMRVPAELFAAQHDRLIIVCFYHARSLGLVRAFRSQGKPVVDVQHGVVGAVNCAYAREEAWRVRSRLQPTGFLVWNRATQSYLQRITGREAWVRWFDDSRFAETVPTLRSGQPRVLVALQWGCELPGLLVDFMEATTDIDWVLRMHPRDRLRWSDRSDCVRLSRAATVQIEHADRSLAMSLRECDLVLTWGSSVVAEAALIGKKSIFWDPVVHESFKSEIESGLSEFLEVNQIPTRVAEICAAVRRS